MTREDHGDERLSEWTTAGLHDHLWERLPALDRRTPALDVGCGTGAWLARLAREGFVELYGVDRVERGPDVVMRVPGRYAQVDVDAGPMPFPDAMFGLITALEVIEHLHNPGAFLRDVRRMLRADGAVVITTPNVQSTAARLRWLVGGRLPFFDEKGEPTHVSPVFVPLLERALPRYGLRIERVWSYPDAPRHFRWPLRLLARASRRFIADPLPGDCLCLILRAVP